MKKIIFSMMMCMVSLASWGYDIEVDGIFYNIIPKAKSAEVVASQYNVTGSIIIPGVITYEGVEYKVTSIADKAFNEKKNITSVEIPNSVAKIGKEAFNGCGELASIKIPSSIKQIDEKAFYECRNLNSVYITDLTAWCGIIFKDIFSNPISSYYDYYKPRNLYLNGELTTGLVIPSTVTEIDDYAFSSWENLTTITIPNSVKSIGKNAFSNCSNLKNLYISDITAWCNITFHNEKSNPLCNAYMYTAGSDRVHYRKIDFFVNNQIVSNLEIPSGVTRINSYAFQNCYNLTSVAIPNSVTSIGDYAFVGCDAISSLKLPSSINSINDGTFQDCIGLTHIEIPNSVTAIGAYAFSYCRSLNSVTIPNSVKTIGRWAFSSCDNLTSISIPNSVTRIEESAFQSCTGLSSITVPNGVSKIEFSTFRDCTGLTSVSIPISVKEILSYAFCGCKALISIPIPNSVTRISSYAFSSCTSLESIIIPNSVLNIESYAFLNCAALTTITIGKSVNYISYSAFSGCKNLEEVYCYAVKVPRTENNAFKDSFIDYARLFVLEESLANYRATKPWSEFGSIESIEHSTSIDGIENPKSTHINYANGFITISGHAEGERVDAYSTEGKHLCSVQVKGETTIIPIGTSHGVIVLKVGGKIKKILVH